MDIIAGPGKATVQFLRFKNVNAAILNTPFHRKPVELFREEEPGG